MKLIPVCPLISLILTPILTFSPLWAQAPALTASSPAPDAGAAQTLQLRLISSESSEAGIGSQTVKGFTVQVTDPSGTPVADAAVAVRLPDSGATGAFGDGTHSAVSYTDAAGRANIAAIQWATTPGLVAMRITATKGTSHAGMLVEQTLVGPVDPALSIAAPTPAPPPVSTTVVNVPPPAPAQPATAETVSKSITPAQIATLQTPQVQVGPAPQASSASSAAAPKVATQNAAPQAQPSVSVSSAPPGQTAHTSHAKWFILLAIAAGAGIGVAMVGKGKGTSTTAAPSISIGAPTVSVGQPPH